MDDDLILQKIQKYTLHPSWCIAGHSSHMIGPPTEAHTRLLAESSPSSEGETKILTKPQPAILHFFRFHVHLMVKEIRLGGTDVWLPWWEAKYCKHWLWVVCVPWPKALDWARQSSNQADFFTITHTLPSQTKVHVELPNCHRQSLHHPK